MKDSCQNRVLTDKPHVDRMGGQAHHKASFHVDFDLELFEMGAVQFSPRCGMAENGLLNWGLGVIL